MVVKIGGLRFDLVILIKVRRFWDPRTSTFYNSDQVTLVKATIEELNYNRISYETYLLCFRPVIS